MVQTRGNRSPATRSSGRASRGSPSPPRTTRSKSPVAPASPPQRATRSRSKSATPTRTKRMGGKQETPKELPKEEPPKQDREDSPPAVETSPVSQELKEFESKVREGLMQQEETKPVKLEADVDGMAEKLEPAMTAAGDSTCEIKIKMEEAETPPPSLTTDNLASVEQPSLEQEPPAGDAPPMPPLPSSYPTQPYPPPDGSAYPPPYGSRYNPYPPPPGYYPPYGYAPSTYQPKDAKDGTNKHSGYYPYPPAPYYGGPPPYQQPYPPYGGYGGSYGGPPGYSPEQKPPAPVPAPAPGPAQEEKETGAETESTEKPSEPEEAYWDEHYRQASDLIRTGSKLTPMVEGWIHEQIKAFQTGGLPLTRREQLCEILRGSGIPIPPPPVLDPSQLPKRRDGLPVNVYYKGMAPLIGGGRSTGYGRVDPSQLSERRHGLPVNKAAAPAAQEEKETGAETESTEKPGEDVAVKVDVDETKATESSEMKASEGPPDAAPPADVAVPPGDEPPKSVGGIVSPGRGLERGVSPLTPRDVEMPGETNDALVTAAAGVISPHHGAYAPPPYYPPSQHPSYPPPYYNYGHHQGGGGYHPYPPHGYPPQPYHHMPPLPPGGAYGYGPPGPRRTTTRHRPAHAPEVQQDRKEHKNSQARQRQADTRQRIQEIEAKPEYERTDDEKVALCRFLQRRDHKNIQSRQRAQLKKEKENYILSKPTIERTQEEQQWLEEHTNNKKRKSEGDRLRRQRIKELGLSARNGGKPGISARGPLPPEYQAILVEKAAAGSVAEGSG